MSMFVHNHYEKLDHAKPNVCVITSTKKRQKFAKFPTSGPYQTYLVIYWHMMFHIKTRIHAKPNNTSIQCNISPFVNKFNKNQVEARQTSTKKLQNLVASTLHHLSTLNCHVLTYKITIEFKLSNGSIHFCSL
jgi:hypothetical protein